MSFISGYPMLCNKTPYAWGLVSNSSSNMITWNPPKIIDVGYCENGTITFQPGTKINKGIDVGVAGYKIGDTTDTFQVKAYTNNTSNQWLEIFYQNLTTNLSQLGTNRTVLFPQGFSPTWTLLGSHGGYNETFVSNTQKV